MRQQLHVLTRHSPESHSKATGEGPALCSPQHLPFAPSSALLTPRGGGVWSAWGVGEPSERDRAETTPLQGRHGHGPGPRELDPHTV